jgi:hypothetical protein
MKCQYMYVFLSPSFNPHSQALESLFFIQKLKIKIFLAFNLIGCKKNAAILTFMPHVYCACNAQTQLLLEYLCALPGLSIIYSCFGILIV